MSILGCILRVSRRCGGRAVDAGPRSWRNDGDYPDGDMRSPYSVDPSSRVLGWDGEGDPVGFLMAVMGALLELFVFRKLTGPPRVWVKGAHDVIKAAASSPHPALGVAELEYHNPVP